MTDDPNENGVDPENPRPEGHYPRFRSNTWHYVPDELSQTISLGPLGDPGDDWVLTYTPERENENDREKVLVRLSYQFEDATPHLADRAWQLAVTIAGEYGTTPSDAVRLID